MADPGIAPNVTDVLERIILGEPLLKKDYLAAAEAAASIRKDFLWETARALGQLAPGTPEFAAFKNCMQSMGLLFVKPGIVTNTEMQSIFMRIEEMER